VEAGNREPVDRNKVRNSLSILSRSANVKFIRINAAFPAIGSQKTARGLSSVKANLVKGLVRTFYVPQIQESQTHSSTTGGGSSTVVCGDCKEPSRTESLIPVDALHVQCPICLYVFFMEPFARKKHGAAD
jgi:hypothetical protein